MLRSKLFALCDRGIDLADCIALAPTIGELAALRPWLDRQDGNPDWPAHVGEVLSDVFTAEEEETLASLLRRLRDHVLEENTGWGLTQDDVDVCPSAG